MRRLAFVVLALAASRAGAMCVDWKASGPFADIEAADLIFEGTVMRVEADPKTRCGPDRVVVKVKRVWKGGKDSEYKLLQPTRRTYEGFVDGKFTVSGCPIWSESDFLEAGQSYIVFAASRDNGIHSMGCGLSQPPTAALRKRLDTWVRKGRAK